MTITNEQALKALAEIKTYCAAKNLNELRYVIDVLKHLESQGITDPLNTDFTALKK